MALSETEVTDALQRLKAAIEIEKKSTEATTTSASTSTSQVPSIGTILDDMISGGFGKRMTLALLTSTRIGATVNSLRNHADARVSGSSRKLVEAWKKTAEDATSVSSPSAAKKSVSTSSSLSSSSASKPAPQQTTLPLAYTAKTTQSSSSTSSSSSSSTPSSSALLHPYDQLYLGLSNASGLDTDDLATATGYSFDFPQETAVHKARIRDLKRTKSKSAATTTSSTSSSSSSSSPPVIYWMSRDQRVLDNWALIRAQQVAKSRSAPLLVLFNLVPSFLNAPVRAYGFMLRALRQIEFDLANLGISFRVVLGEPSNCVAGYVNAVGCTHLIVDYTPLRLGRKWRQDVAARLADTVSFEEVDAHNIVPVWEASPKLEVGARTIRGKIRGKIQEFCTAFPPMAPHPYPFTGDYAGIEANFPVYSGQSSNASASGSSSSSSSSVATVADVRLAPSASASSSSHNKSQAIDWPILLSHLSIDYTIPEVSWAKPGERAAQVACSRFLTQRLSIYDQRNDPTLPQAQSNLSPWLHFGHISAQRIVLEVMKTTGFKLPKLFPDGERTIPAASFCEELVVRKEVAENFCHYEPHYDTIEGAAGWASDSLLLHASDKREHLYSLQEFETARTKDPLWNSAQTQMIHTGKMAGWCRMYWAKKILEWTESPQVALSTAIYLNDKYSIDGRDPNGYVGCMWSICGTHDMGWAERAIFGKIRFMNYDGAKRKFDVGKYVNMHPVRKLPVWPSPKCPGGAAAVAGGSGGGGAGGGGAGSSK